MIIHIISWIIFGLIAGSIAKWLHPGEDPEGWVATTIIGIAGSFIGGIINFAIGWGHNLISASGLFMSIVGGVICCTLYRALRDGNNWQ